ncbi:MAG: hypothetical protein N3A60_05255, partial [Thermanaerothrix sp.]|nr:hypothetical protein [Thermanaerothrix sp.]
MCIRDRPSATLSHWISDSITPTLFILEKTYHGPEDETATGPNFPRRYTITATIAPGQTMNAFNLSDVLPNNMQFVALVSTSPSSASCTLPSLSTPGGTLSCDFASVSGTVSMTFEYYIPLRDAIGNSVISPTNGDDATSCNNATGGGTWTPIDTRDASGTFIQNEAGCEHVLTDKSIAIQKSVANLSPAPLSPGDTLEYTLQVQVDGAPPALNLTAPTTSWVPGGALTLQAQASDGESGVALVNVYWRPNSRAPWQLLGQDWEGRDGWTWATTSAALAGGDLYVEAVDFGGNRSGALRLGLRVDANPPSVDLEPLTSPNPSTAVRLAWTAQDAESGVAGITLQARVGSGNWQTLSGSLTVPQGSAWYLGTLGQTLSFRAQVWDNVGYQSSWSAERATQIEASCTLDAYESNDNTFAGAVSLVAGGSQDHTLCRAESGVNDEDWLIVDVAEPKPYFFAIRSLGGGAAVRAEIYAADGSTRLATFAAPDLGRDLSFVWTPPQAGRYALRLTPLVSGLAGSAARYSVSYNHARFLYMPLVSR